MTNPTPSSMKEAEIAAPCEEREKTKWWLKWEEDFGLPTHECDPECDEDCPYLAIDVKVIDVYDFISDLLDQARQQGRDEVARIGREAIEKECAEFSQILTDKAIAALDRSLKELTTKE